jgi:integrase/recombinase XerD
VDAYRRDLANYRLFMTEKGVNLNKIDYKDLIDWVNHLQQSKKPTSVNRMVSSITGFHQFLFEHYKISDPTVKLSVTRAKNPLPKTLTRADIHRLLDSFPSTPLGEYQKTICEILFATGLRVSELCQLQFQQSMLKKGFFESLVRETKSESSLWPNQR